MPTATPTASPTNAPTDEPTDAPTAVPTDAPSAGPTASPTHAPTTACLSSCVGKVFTKDRSTACVNQPCPASKPFVDLGSESNNGASCVAENAIDNVLGDCCDTRTCPSTDGFSFVGSVESSRPLVDGGGEDKAEADSNSNNNSNHAIFIIM